MIELKQLPEDDPIFQERIERLYQLAREWITLPAGEAPQQLTEVKRRFALYWTHEARHNMNPDDWRAYLQECLEMPGYLTTSNAEAMEAAIANDLDNLALVVPSGYYLDLPPWLK